MPSSRYTAFGLYASVALATLVCACAEPVAKHEASSFVCQGALYAPQVSSSRPTALRTEEKSSILLTYSFVATTEPLLERVTRPDGSVETIYQGDLSPLLENIGEEDERGIAPFPTDAGARVRQAFETWSEVTSITFKEVYEPVRMGDIRIGVHPIAPVDANSRRKTLGHAIVDDVTLGGGIHFHSEWTDTPDLFLGVAIHEIGHTLLLEHIVAPTDNVVMAPPFGESDTGHSLSDADIAYVQSLHGPKPPILQTSLDQGTVKAISWQKIATNDRSSAFYAGEISNPSPTSSDVAITSIEKYPPTRLELKATLMELDTETDGAESSHESLFDLTFADGTVKTVDGETLEIKAWEASSLLPLSGDRSFHIDADSVSLVAKPFRLPQKDFLLGSEKTTIAFTRASLLAPKESFTASYSVFGDVPIELVHEVGSGDFSVAKRPKKQFTFPLPAVANRHFKLDFSYAFDGSKWPPDNNVPGVQLDDIEIRNVYVPRESAITLQHSNLDQSFWVANLDPGVYQVEIRTEFANGTKSVYASGFAQTASKCTDPCGPGCSGHQDCSETGCEETNACGQICGSPCDTGCSARLDCTDLACGQQNSCGTTCGTTCDEGCLDKTDCSGLVCGQKNACGTTCGSPCDIGCSAKLDCTGLACGEKNTCGTTCGSTCDEGCPDNTDCTSLACGEKNTCGTTCGSTCDVGCSAKLDCTGLACGEKNTCGTTCGSTCDEGCPDNTDCTGLSCGQQNSCGTICGSQCDTGCSAQLDCTGIECGQKNSCGTTCGTTCDSPDAAISPARPDLADQPTQPASGCSSSSNHSLGACLLIAFIAGRIRTRTKSTILVP